jgi:hypothetical protein
MFYKVTPVNPEECDGFTKLLVQTEKIAAFGEKDGKVFMLNDNGDAIEIKETFEELAQAMVF